MWTLRLFFVCIIYDYCYFIGIHLRAKRHTTRLFFWELFEHYSESNGAYKSPFAHEDIYFVAIIIMMRKK